MTQHRRSSVSSSLVRTRALALAASIGCAPISARPADAQTVERIAYTLRVPAPDDHTLEVAARIPTGGQDSVILMMPIWSPGFYRVEDYAGKIQAISATGPGGETLAPVLGLISTVGLPGDLGPGGESKRQE